MATLLEISTEILNDKNANLLPQNLKTGITVFDINGTFTSDATAQSKDIANGKTAYVKGSKVIGNLPVVSSGNYHDSSNEISIGSDSIEIAINSDMILRSGSKIKINKSDFASLIGLIPEKLKVGETIIGITGNFTGDADATADDILKDKTAYVNGEKLTGTVDTTEEIEVEVVDPETGEITIETRGNKY